MKIRTRLAIAFVTITVVPIVLIFVAAFGLVNYQEHLFQKTYGLSEQIDLLSGNQTQVFNRLTQGIQEEIREAVGENTDLFEEPAYLNKVNEELRDKYSYLVIRKGKDITFCGSEDGRELCERLAPYGDQGSMAGSIYMDGEEQHLVKQIDFRFSDDSQGSVFIVTNVGDYVPEIKAGAKCLAFGDFSYYWIGDRQGRSFKRLNEVFAMNGQVGFLASQRVDGRLILTEAVKTLGMKA